MGTSQDQKTIRIGYNKVAFSTGKKKRKTAAKKGDGRKETV